MSWMLEPGQDILIRFKVKDTELVTDMINHMDNITGIGITDLNVVNESCVDEIREVLVEKIKEEYEEIKKVTGFDKAVAQHFKTE